jgi:prophage regulatory protein
MPKQVQSQVDRPAAYASDAALAAHFGVNKATIWGWAKRNNFPQPVKLSPQMTRWRWGDVAAWEAAQSQAA